MDISMTIDRLAAVSIGRVNDGDVTRIRIDCSRWLKDYPFLTDYQLQVTAPNGYVYFPASVQMDGRALVWTVTQSDTARTGDGMMEVVAVGKNGQRKTSDHVRVMILDVMPGTASEAPPDPARPWVVEVMNAAYRAEEAAKRAENAAGGVEVTPEQIKQAVDDYLTENPVQETDPNVPEWAKQPNPPAPYDLPTASADTKGGVKVGSGLQMDGDVLGVDKQLTDKIDALSKEMADKMSSEEYTAETETSVIDVEFANAANMTGTGKYYPLSTGKNHVMCKEFIPVIPGGAYTFRFTISAESEPNVYFHFYTERDELEYVGVVNKYPYEYDDYTVKFNAPPTAHYMRIVLYLEGEPVANLIPRDMLLYLTGTEPVLEGARVIATKKLDVPGIHREMVAQGLVDGGRVIPAYYNSYLPGKINRITELYDACAGNGDAFVFVTDQHWTLNAGNSPAIIGHIMQAADIYRVFCGGDMAEGYNTNYIASMCSNVDRSIYWAIGNHEYNQRNGHELCRVLDGGKDNQIGNPLRHYYYVDNRQQKIRYVLLSPFDRDIANSTVTSQYEAEQIAWLTDDALKVETGWTVIVFTHCLYYGDASSAALTAWPDGASSVVSALDAATCDVACIIQGHLHLDRICHTPGGIPVVATTCDKYMPWIDGETNMEPWMSNRVEGTITEQAFDAVVLDKAQRKLTFVRIGAPADNWTDGTSTGTVEERVVTY